MTDGYDLAAWVQQWTNQLDMMLFSVDEARGKYLDLQPQFEELGRIGTSVSVSRGNGCSSNSNSLPPPQSFVTLLRSTHISSSTSSSNTTTPGT